MAWSKRLRVPAIAIACVILSLVAGCEAPAPDWSVPGLPSDSLVFSGAIASAEPGEQPLAARQAEHRAMEAVDSLFPHSEHRDVECRRCHRRPPGHATHDAIECRACHGRPAGFATLPVRTPIECAGCHHEDATQQRCRGCHEADEVGARPVLVAVQAAGATEPRVRGLTFDHDDHQSRECLTCHTTSITLEYGRECGSCHEYHHRQDARCMTCHVEVDTPVHSTEVHAGCAGGGCHGDAPVLSVAPERNVCQVCHQDMADHRPGRQCTACHIGFGDNLRTRAGGGR